MMAAAKLTRQVHVPGRRRAGRTCMAVACAALALLAGLPGAALAQAAWPNKPITLLVPFAAGGTVDKVARTLAEPLRARLGQPVIIENKAGAGGTIGMAALAKAAPDGHTLAMVFDSYATEQHIYRKLPYTTLTDFTGIATLVRAPMVLVVPAASPYTTLAQYVAAARKPGAVSYASVGAGSSNQLAAVLFHDTAGTQGLHVPFKGGGPAITDLVGGHVDSMIASLPLVLQQIEGGRLRALAVTSPRRSPALPQVPALAETYPGFEVHSWVAFVAPARTPVPVLDRLQADAAAVLRSPAVARQLTEGGFEVVAASRDDTNRLLRAESERWGRLIQRHQIAAE